MTKRNLFLVLFASLALTVVSTACGGTDDPTGDDTTGGGTTGGGTTGGGTTGGGTTGGGTTGGGTTGGGTTTNNTTGGGTTGGGTTGGGTTTNNTTGGGTTGGACAVNQAYRGQIGGSKPNDGGTFTTTPLADNANVQGTWDRVQQHIGGGGAVTNSTKIALSPSILINGATITATRFQADKAFYIEDGQAAMQVYLATALSGITVKVGQKVNFEITELAFYNGLPQISAIAGLTVASEGNPVPVRDRSGQTIDVTQDIYRIVRVGGVANFTEVCDNPDRANPNKCYGLQHGPDAAHVINLRSNSQFLADKDCVTFVGPVGAFPGLFGQTDPAAPQIETFNYDWLFDPPAL